jgi:hypothetical protein
MYNLNWEVVVLTTEFLSSVTDSSLTIVLNKIAVYDREFSGIDLV